MLRYSGKVAAKMKEKKTIVDRYAFQANTKKFKRNLKG